MQKVIQGKRYNTNAAKLVAKKDGLELYRKTTGEYFTFNQKDIGIITLEEAKEIGSQIMEPKDFDLEFNVREENSTALRAVIPNSLHKALSEQAKENKSTIKDELVEILHDHFTLV